LLNLTLGHYVVVETDLPGYASSAPGNNRLAFNLTTLTATNGNNFFDYLPSPASYSTISGTVWNDANGNGTNDLAETGLANVSLDLVQDVNTNGLADAGEPAVASTTTDANGNYSSPGSRPATMSSAKRICLAITTPAMRSRRTMAWCRSAPAAARRSPTSGSSSI